VSRLYPRNRNLSEPIERLDLRVELAEEGRLDAFLAKRLPWRSRTGARELIEEGLALVNGERRKPSTKVRAGDRVTVDVRRAPAPPRDRPQVRVLFEDEHLLALDKEPGVVVHPVGPHQEGTLLQELHRRAPEGPLPKLAHRLDQHTSGVLLVAKGDAVRAALSDMLERGDVRKTYEALLLGRVEWDRREVDAPIGPVADSRILHRVDPERGKDARSVFTVKERFRFATHVEVAILTGRTHQIRVHAAHLGHPLLGDHLYGDGIAVGAFERFALHARSVVFRHPVTGADVAIEAPLPEAFRDAIVLLRG
jgi:23S rRNA pseudouridine1911/1915/1917 synthase